MAFSDSGYCSGVVVAFSISLGIWSFVGRCRRTRHAPHWPDPPGRGLYATAPRRTIPFCYAVERAVPVVYRGLSVAKSEPIELEAVVTLALPNAMFKLKLDNSDREILGIVSGKMRKHFIRILPGDRVKVELSPYDLTKGRIIFRQK